MLLKTEANLLNRYSFVSNWGGYINSTKIVEQRTLVLLQLLITQKRLVQ